MAYIKLPVAPELGCEFPGIVGPMTFRPETAAPINQLVNILLRGESTLSPGERELIATHVSWRNDCFFCRPSTAPSPLLSSTTTRFSFKAPKPISSTPPFLPN
jgi:hypothetical protein